MLEVVNELFTHMSKQAYHPIRLLRRHLPYPGKAIHQAAFGRRDYIPCPFSLLRSQLPRGEAYTCTF